MEIVTDATGDIYFGLTVIDHAAGIDYAGATTPLEIAALSRTISANVWQKRPELGAKHGIDWWLGRVTDRNVVLKINKR